MTLPLPKSEKPVIEMHRIAAGSLRDPLTTVLEDVNWSVAPGSYWVVAGMHGSGKSDFVNLTGGLLPPLQGVYLLFGHEMPIFEEHLLPERLRMGLVFEDGRLLHQMNVAENIALPMRYHRNLERQLAVDRLHALLELTELTDWADRTAGAIGRNWQKRAGLARALVLEPEVLIVDNPLGGLDLRHANWWLNFLGQLNAGHSFFGGRRMTLVVTTEDLRPWRNRASHFAVLEEKRFRVLGGRPGLADHQEGLVKELLAEEVAGI